METSSEPKIDPNKAVSVATAFALGVAQQLMIKEIATRQQPKRITILLRIVADLHAAKFIL